MMAGGDFIICGAHNQFELNRNLLFNGSAYLVFQKNDFNKGKPFRIELCCTSYLGEPVGPRLQLVMS